MTGLVAGVVVTGGRTVGRVVTDGVMVEVTGLVTAFWAGLVPTLAIGRASCRERV